MKNLIIAFFALLSFVAVGQPTDAERAASNALIRSHSDGQNTKSFIAGVFDQYNQGKVSRTEALATAGTNTYTVSADASITGFAKSFQLFLRFPNANTGASTLNVNSLGAKNLKSNAGTALTTGDIVAASYHWVVYDVAAGVFKLAESAGGSGGGGTWGTITGTLSDQTDLQSALDLKADLISPTLVTPNIGTPSAGIATNITGLPINSGVSGLGTGVATFLGTPTSANLATAVTNETGSGALVFGTSPTFVTPLLGTPTSGVATNITGLPLSTGITGFGTGWLSPLAASLGSGWAAAFNAAYSAGGSQPFADNTDLFKNSSDATKLIRFGLSGITTGTTRTWTFPDVNGTFARNDAAQTFTGVQTFSSAPSFGVLPTGSGVASAATASTLVSRDASANIFANNTIDGYTTIATAAGTTTLTVASTQNQYFTGSTTQTLVLPVTSTLALGLQFFVTNNSSGIVTVNSSGSNLVQSMTSNSFAVYTVILTSGTSAASWSVNYFPPNPGTTVGDIYAVTSVSGGVGIPGRVVAGTSNYALLGQGAGVLPAYGQITSDMVLGATTNGSAAAGFIGEDVTSLIASGSATSLTTATAKNITSISLTAGNWNVKGNVNFTETSATVTARSAGISSTTATVPTDGSEAYLGTATSTLSETNSITMTEKVIKLSATTTIYLVGAATFSAGTVTAFGMITATRVR